MVAWESILAAIQPVTVRAVCYRLFVLMRSESMSKGDTGKVSKQPTWARQEGAILDALSPVILRERVEDRILGLPNVDAWSQALGIAAAERESMKIVLTNWRSHSRQTLKCS